MGTTPARTTAERVSESEREREREQERERESKRERERARGRERAAFSLLSWSFEEVLHP